MFTKAIGGAAIATAVLAAAPAQATVVNLTSSTNSATWDASQVGTKWSMGTFDGITVSAAAYTSSDLSGSVAYAYLGRYQNGLGVSTAASDEHYVDNINSYDFIALVFSKAVRLTDISRYQYGAGSDAWISYGTSGVTTWDQYFSRGTNVGSSVGAIGNNFGTVWLVGTARTAVSRDDGFKLTSITVTTVPAVPEPATWMMMILGFGAVGATLRRRRAAVRVTFA